MGNITETTYFEKLQEEYEEKEIKENRKKEIKMEREFEYDDYGRKFKRLKGQCSHCRESCFNAFQTLKKCGFQLEVVKSPETHLFKRVRNVTHQEHGITKNYKGVYACVVCGEEQIMDNQMEKENNE